jgi:hypothetical protein
LSSLPPAGPPFHRTWRAIEARRLPIGRIAMSEEINQQRRRFFGTAAMTIAAARFGMIGSANAQTKPAALPAIKPGAHTSFGSLKQIDAGVLNVGHRSNWRHDMSGVRRTISARSFLNHSTLGRCRSYQCMSDCRAVSQLGRSSLAFATFPRSYSAASCEEMRFRRSISVAVPGARHSMTANNGESHEGADGDHIPRPTG